MIPVVSAEPVPSPFAYRVRNENEPLVDFALGPVSVGDASGGLAHQQWVSSYSDGTILLTADDGETFSLPAASVLRVAFDFDQNGRAAIAYESSEGVYFYWYDASTSSYETTLIPGVTRCCVCLDDRRAANISDSDVWLSYTREGIVYCRVQRERYSTEYEIGPGQLSVLGMGQGYRMQWRVV